MNAIAIVKYVFTAVGVVMLAGAGFWVQSTRSFIEGAAAAEGTVIDLVASRSSNSTTWAPVVRFTASDGRQIEFTSGTSSSPPSYERGETVEVLYTPGEARSAKIKGFFSLWGGATIVVGLGTVFLLVGGGIIAATALRRHSDENLRHTGTRILTSFQRVELNTGLSMNGRHPYRVFTQWQNPATSEIHVFESDNLWFDPSQFLDGRAITVFIEPGNPRKYLVDLSFLPRLAA